MSLDDRCQIFHEAALGTGRSKGAIKEIAALRKFLHKNQNQRFTDKGVSRLFDTIQIYVKKHDLDMDVKESLLEDSLKLPFTVFSTKQKKSMIQWLEDVRGSRKPTASMASIENASTSCILSVIDLENGSLTLMQDDTGYTFENVQLPQGDLGKSIRVAFENTDSCIFVEAEMAEEHVRHILRLVR